MRLRSSDEHDTQALRQTRVRFKDTPDSLPHSSAAQASPEVSSSSEQEGPVRNSGSTNAATARGWLPTFQETAIALLVIAGASALLYSTILFIAPDTIDLEFPHVLRSPGWLRTRSRPSPGRFDLSRTTTSVLTRTLPIGRRDFALSDAGGKIYPDLTSAHGIDISSSATSSSPDTVLSDDFRISGCWSIPGSHLQVGVVLSETIYPSHFTIDHVPYPLADDIFAAPRRVILWGVVDGSSNKETYAHLRVQSSELAAYNRSAPPMDGAFTFIPLATFEYDIYADSHVQTFPIYTPVVRSGIDVGLVVLDVVSNWGSNTTSLCRLRVHGTLSSSCAVLSLNLSQARPESPVRSPLLDVCLGMS